MLSPTDDHSSISKMYSHYDSHHGFDPTVSLSASLEDYIEAIYYICEHRSHAKSSEIAYYLHVKPSSVTRALRHLSEHGYIQYAKYKSVVLTEKGISYSKYLLYRHRRSYEFLHFVLGLDTYQADKVAQDMKKLLTKDVLSHMEIFLRTHSRTNAHQHEDCHHNQFRCMLCQLTEGIHASYANAKMHAKPH